MVTLRRPLELLTYASCILGVAPLYLYLQPLAQVAAPAALVLGIACDRRDRYPLGRHAATLLSLLLFAWYATRIDRTVLVEPVVNILVLLLAIRLVTAKTGRNYLQIFLLAIFALAGSSLLSLNLLFLPALVLLVLCVTIGLVLLCFFGSDSTITLRWNELRSVLGTAVLLPAGSLLLMLFFFAILPRTEHPLWNFLNPAAAASSGFSQTVSPGAFASNAANPELVFRVESEELPPEELYWRGTVLNRLQENTWVREEPPTGEQERLRGGRPIEQTIYLEPQSDRFLFALDLPREVTGIRSRVSSDRVSKLPAATRKRVSYQAISLLGARLEPVGKVDTDFYLQLPAQTSERLRATAASLAAGSRDAAEKVSRTEAFFRAQQLNYATDDLPGPAAPIDEFLFTKKRGYCEFFASSFAILLRLEGVPARLVGGFFGGTRSEFGGYYTLTGAAAHVWVEALVDGRWQRLDPSRLAQNGAAILAAAGSRPQSWSRSLRDVAEYYWTRVVITYDLGSQLNLARDTGRKLRALRPGQLAAPDFLLPGAILLFLAGGIWLGRRWRIPLERRLAQRFLRLAARRYHLGEIPATVGLESLARRLKDPRCTEFVAILSRALYRDRRLSPVERQRLQVLLKALRRREV